VGGDIVDVGMILLLRNRGLGCCEAATAAAMLVGGTKWDMRKGGIKDGGGRRGLWGKRGRELNLIRSISASFNRLSLALLFWNQILTCVSVRFKDALNSALSAILRYCFSRNFFSNARSCWVVKGVLGFLLGLCLRRVTFTGPKNRGVSADSGGGREARNH